jgi:mannose-1-phosphate guanylyltransferase
VHAVILAGGLGTRLRRLVRDLPKPMVDIAGRPFLEYLLLQLRAEGFDRAVLCTGHMGGIVRDYFGTGERLGLSIGYSEEPEPLGTGGALRLAEPLLQGDRWLVLNGDSFLDTSFRQLVEVHASSGALATLALVEVDDPQRYGSVSLGSGTEIGAFVEKGAAGGPALINGGVYVLERQVLELIPPGRQVSLEREVFPRLVGRGLHGVQVAGTFIDIGVPDDYLRLRDAPDLLLRLVR